MLSLSEEITLDHATWTPLMRATLGESVEKVKELIENGANIMETSQDGNTVLHVACVFNVEAFDLYKDLFNPNVQNKRGISPLMFLAASYCEFGSYMVHSLLKKGADVNLRDCQGKTALIYALEYGQETMAMDLDANGELNWNVTDNFGNTPLSLAMELKNDELVEYISSRIQLSCKTSSDSSMATPIMQNESDHNAMNTFNPLQDKTVVNHECRSVSEK